MQLFVGQVLGQGEAPQILAHCARHQLSERLARRSAIALSLIAPYRSCLDWKLASRFSTPMPL